MFFRYHISFMKIELRKKSRNYGFNKRPPKMTKSLVSRQVLERIRYADITNPCISLDGLCWPHMMQLALKL